MKILSLHTGHNATAAYLNDGVLIHCISEERLSRVKNDSGYPAHAIKKILDTEGIQASELDAVVLCGLHPSAQFYKSELLPITWVGKLKELFMWGEQFSPLLRRIGDWYMNKYGFHTRVTRAVQNINSEVSERLKIPREKILRFDHHLCHAAAPYFGLCDTREPWLVITVDGGGDDTSMTVNIARDGVIEPISRTPVAFSLGCFYSAITEYLGMKPLEHEYKVMGLAPYAYMEMAQKTYSALKKLIWFDEKKLQWNSLVRNPLYLRFFDINIKHHRFDQVAGAAQKITEELLEVLVRSAILRTGISNVAFGGGVFLNVKANMRIYQMPEVKRLVIFPSPGDESLPMGAAFLAYKKLTRKAPQSISNIYFGPSYSKLEIVAALQKNGYKEKYDIKESPHIERDIAELLANNKIVARMSGRMEWGARALGNRSIMAHPQNKENIRIINEQIKGRDFWMPFAASILSDRSSDYIINPRNADAPHMILAFETTPLAREELSAALHPYDFTCRPQIVSLESNPSYYKIIKSFEAATGIGGILNTSFNLHGDPMVCSPEDALYTFEHSGLQYLALENYLISKR